MPDIEVIYDLLKEVREDQKKHGEELNNQSRTLISIKKDVEINTRDLTDHKEGVIQNRDTIKKLFQKIDDVDEKYEEEIEELKEPGKFKKWLYNRYVKVFGSISLILGTVLTATRLLGYW